MSQQVVVSEPFLDRGGRPSVAVDIAVLTILDDALHVLLVTRGIEPFLGRLALPGGFVRVGRSDDGAPRGGESVDEAAARELTEETGVPASHVLLEQVHAFGAPGRDPRGRVVSVAYAALVRPELAANVHGGSDAADAGLYRVDALDRARLAFDHALILEVVLAHVRRRVDDSTFALSLVPAAFTIAELRRVVEAVHGERLDAATFHRKVRRLLEDGVVERAPGKRITGKKPAQVFRAVVPPRS